MGEKPEEYNTNGHKANGGLAKKPRRLNRLEAKDLSGLSLSTIKRAINKGSLPSFKVEGARFILYEDFIDWLGYDPLEPN